MDPEGTSLARLHFSIVDKARIVFCASASVGAVDIVQKLFLFFRQKVYSRPYVSFGIKL